jgi:hypothetical protein
MPLSILVTMAFLRTMFVVMLVLDCLLCVYGVRLEDRSEYQACIANPAGCGRLYAARPPPHTGQRVRACDALSVAEWLGGCGWGTQGPVLPGAHRHHSYDRGAVDEPDILGPGDQRPHGHHPDERGAIDEAGAIVRFFHPPPCIPR